MACPHRQALLHRFRAPYDEGTVAAVVQSLSEHFRVATGRYFSEVAPIVTVVELVVASFASIPAGMISSWIYDGIKGWVTRDNGNPCHILRVRAFDSEARRELELETPSDEIMQRGLLLPAAPPSSRWFFDPTLDEWRMVSDDGSPTNRPDPTE
jgi:hypothetical protein